MTPQMLIPTLLMEMLNVPILMKVIFKTFQIHLLHLVIKINLGMLVKVLHFTLLGKT